MYDVYTRLGGSYYKATFRINFSCASVNDYLLTGRYDVITTYRYGAGCRGG